MEKTSLQYVMGFDYGSKYIGIAVGQTLTATSHPVAVISVQNHQPDWTHIHTLIQEWQPAMLIVGLPVHADGSSSPIAIAARRFSQQLQKQYQLPVHTIDETLSSVAASDRVRASEEITPTPAIRRIQNKKQSSTVRKENKKNLNAVAAQVILETWFAEYLPFE